MLDFAAVSILAGLANVVGGWLTFSDAISRRHLERLIALGAGFLMGAALLSMVPHALSDSPDGPLFVALGYLGLFTLRRLMPGGHRSRSGSGSDRPGVDSAWAATVGMALHGFFDGGALGATARAGGALAVMAFLAVFLHKVPEGFSLGALVVSATGSRRSAMLATLFAGGATVVGALAAYLWAGVASLSHGALVGIAAGSFLYVGSSDVLPALPRKPGSIWLVLAGAALVYLMAGGGGHVHIR